MLDLYDLPRASAVDQQIFTGRASADGQYLPWYKPRGCTFVHFLMIGAGAGGGAGFSGAASAAGGGGGGGAGAIGVALYLAQQVADVLYVSPALGGAGGASSGSAGSVPARSSIQLFPQVSRASDNGVNYLVTSTLPAGGGAGTGAAGGAAGTAGAIAFGTNSMFELTSVNNGAAGNGAGTGGFNSNSSGGGNINNWPILGGIGGGSIGTTGAGFTGLQCSYPVPVWTQSGEANVGGGGSSSGSPNGQDGARGFYPIGCQVARPLLSFKSGGGGGGSWFNAGVGGRGGNGGYGCGGGGGGGGITGGAGGDGGPALIIITAF